jgi:hypothetical protein
MKLQNSVLVAALTALTWVVINIGSFRLASAEVEAQSTNYQECFFGHRESVDINNQGQVEEPDQDRLIKIPKDWTVVSGGGYEDGGVILFCR